MWVEEDTMVPVAQPETVSPVRATIIPHVRSVAVPVVITAEPQLKTAMLPTPATAIPVSR